MRWGGFHKGSIGSLGVDCKAHGSARALTSRASVEPHQKKSKDKYKHLSWECESQQSVGPPHHTTSLRPCSMTVTDPSRTHHGPIGLITDPSRTHHGPITDPSRTHHGPIFYRPRSGWRTFELASASPSPLRLLTRSLASLFARSRSLLTTQHTL